MKSLFQLFLIIGCALVSFKAAGQSVELSSTLIDFGEVTYLTPDSVEIEITNLTEEVLDIEEVVFFDVYESSPFRVSGLTDQLDPMTSASFYVVFDPVHNIFHNSELVIKTSGNRGSASINLNGMAVYDDPYYDVLENAIDEDLEEELAELLADGYITQSYDDARDEMYLVIDNQAVNGQGAVVNTLTRAYIGTDAVDYDSRGDLFNNYSVNTEHTFPQGLFNQDLPMRTDVHHLFPTDINANSTRGSLRFGNVVNNVTWSVGGSQRGNDSSGNEVFEPRDGQKGATARAILYFIVRYENYGGLVSESMEETMREWHFTFPPTPVDVQRNNDIFAFQGNRNPFVDYPQLVNRIFSFRLDEDRPNVGELWLSHDEIDFGEVSAEEVEFNLVLVNPGERFFSVSNVAVSGEGFGLSSESSFIAPEGDAIAIKVSFDPDGVNGLASGLLSFQTNLAGLENVEIPLSAFGVLSAFERTNENFVLYPNPAENHFFIDDLNEGISEVRLLDISGRIVRTYSNPQNTFSLLDVAGGTYLVTIIYDNGKVISGKLMVRP